MKQMGGSQQAARLILDALQLGRADEVKVALAALHRFFPPECMPWDYELRDLLEGVGQEAIAICTAEQDQTPAAAQAACRAVLEHIAGPGFSGISRYLQ